MKLKKECEFCAGTAVMIINPTPNQDPQYDEDYPCDYCSDGLVPNKEIVDERVLELLDTISNAKINLSKIIERYNEFEYRVNEHISYLES
jgi:hypothetical protein